MCSENLAVLLTLILSFISSGNLCKRHSPINVLEEEYFSFCCPKKPQHEGQVIYWYKGKKGEEMLIHGDSRIDLNGSNLQFWPILLNDTGIYQCCLKNGTWKITCKEWSLNVIKRNKSNCFTEEHLLTGRDGIIETGYSFTCSDTNDSTNVINITWYKDCIENINKRGEEEWHIDQLTEKDGGKYTCVKTILHAGKKYNSTSTTNLNVKGTEENVPKLIGSAYNVFKTEIGKEEILNCTAFLGYSKFVEVQYELYWIVHEDIIEICQNNNSPCQKEEHKYNENGKKYVMRQLWFKRVKEENINCSYKCIFSENGFEKQTFILQKECNPDLPVHAFTTGMIMAIMFSFIGVMMVILCVIFKIELILLFRDITGKDETLGDGKLYDAFVSYLKDSTPICGEERKFALEILAKTLEDHFGYKLCIFERDISPGGAIIDDIQSSIDRSRRLIIILSRNYVSDQVMFELEVGLHKALVERKIKVILIEYMPKNYSDFLPKSLELLSPSQVVKWKKEKSLPLKSKFWKKLRYAMPAKPTISAACQGVTLQDRRKTSTFGITSEPSLVCY
ncbi:interleukin-18 receptor 1-like [Vipera latastei]